MGEKEEGLSHGTCIQDPCTWTTWCGLTMGRDLGGGAGKATGDNFRRLVSEQ